MSMSKPDKADMGVDLYVGSPDATPPDWRKGDPDDKILDNDDPRPIGRKLLTEMLGFDPDEEYGKGGSGG